MLGADGFDGTVENRNEPVAGGLNKLMAGGPTMLGSMRSRSMRPEYG